MLYNNITYVHMNKFNKNLMWIEVSLGTFELKYEKCGPLNSSVLPTMD